MQRVKEEKILYRHTDELHSLSGQIERSRPAGQNGTVDYAFDPLSRTTKIASAHFHQSISADGFDAAGNLLKFETQGIPYQFTYDDHYHIQSEEGHTRHGYQFDSLSNRLAKDEEPYHHNHLNSLLQKGEEKFTYDANGNRLECRCGNQVTRYSYDTLNLEGEVVERYRYTVFGEAEILDSTGKKTKSSLTRNPWQFAGKRVDEETGFSAFGLRYYDPPLGRWLTPDPAGFADGLNLYAYVHNSPLLYWDLFGLSTNAAAEYPRYPYFPGGVRLPEMWEIPY